jgi:hypothetical protein
MPADYTIDVERQLVYSRAWGNVTDEDMFDHQRRLALDPLFNGDLFQLIDFLAVTDGKALSTNGVRSIAHRHLFGPRSRRAIVAADLAIYGMARMFETYRGIAGGEEQICVFKNLKDAWAWLGISPA